MSENQNGKRTQKRGENLVGITNENNDNERPQDELESLMDDVVDMIKVGTKAIITKVKDTDKDLAEYKEKTK